MSVSRAATAVAAVAQAVQSGSSRSDCTDCSHCANRSRLRTRAGVRISVNLQHFFSDQRARAFLWAPYGRCVQWLSRRVSRVFGLPDDIALISRGHMLPVTEPLLMLDRDDPIEVVNMSYLFTSHDKNDDTNMSNERVTNETSVLTYRTETNGSEINQENISQFTTSCQGDNDAKHQNIAKASPLEDLETTIEPLNSQSMNESEELQQFKRRALRLLDEHCYMFHEATAPKRLRRRRRRRKLQAAIDAPDASNNEASSRPSDIAAASHNVGADVLRNSSGSRPPRLVHAISL